MTEDARTDPPDPSDPPEADGAAAGKEVIADTGGTLALPDESPYSTLDLDFMKRDDAAGIARVAGPGIGRAAGEGRLLGLVIVRFSELLDRLMERTAPAGSMWSPMRLRPIVFVNSVDLPFAAGEETMEIGPGELESPALRASQMLTRLLTAQAEDDLVDRLRELGETVSSAYEALMALISEEDLTVDWQDRRTPSPQRATGPAASQIVVALDRIIVEPSEKRWFTGTLTRADSDANEFKIRLAEAWGLKRVIPGHYAKPLEPELEALWNRPVRALIVISRRRRARDQVATPDYEMVEVAPAGPTRRAVS